MVDNNGNVYVHHNEPGSYERKIFSLNDEGHLRWDIPVNWGAKALTIGKNDALYFQYKDWDFNKKIAKVSLANGNPNWEVTTNANSNQGGMAIVILRPSR